MKLFQIEEPDGSPADPKAPGAAIGIAANGAFAEVAAAVGGNAANLGDLDAFDRVVSVPPPAAAGEVWREFFLAARLRAERALGRPVTHAVLALAAAPEPAFADTLGDAAADAGIVLLRCIGAAERAGGESVVLAAAILAEDLAPRAARP